MTRHTLHVLLKITTTSDGTETTSVHAIYENRADLDARVAHIAQKNEPFRLRPTSPDSWRIGPDGDDDQGFFGHRPVDLRAVTAPYFTAYTATGS